MPLNIKPNQIKHFTFSPLKLYFPSLLFFLSSLVSTLCFFVCLFFSCFFFIPNTLSFSQFPRFLPSFLYLFTANSGLVVSTDALTCPFLYRHMIILIIIILILELAASRYQSSIFIHNRTFPYLCWQTEARKGFRNYIPWQATTAGYQLAKSFSHRLTF